MKAIPTVYSYRFPEVRRIVSNLTREFPHDVYMRSLDPIGRLDDYHEHIISKAIDYYSPYVCLESFPYKYFINGSSEGIFHYLSKLRTEGKDLIHTFKGEYEGYKEYAKCVDIDTIELSNFFHWDLNDEYIFISNPSAIHGNILSMNELSYTNAEG